MTKSKDKYLLVASFIEGQNFPRRDHVKFIIEAKFDKELLVTDPVEHNDTIEIGQELAWELDRKNLHLHRQQRSCIKANCYALSDTGKEPVGYLVLDIRSASDNQELQKTKSFPLLQPKYPKYKPSLQIRLYLEEDTSEEEQALAVVSPFMSSPQLQRAQSQPPMRPSSSLSNRLSNASSVNNSVELGLNQLGKQQPDNMIKAVLDKEHEYFTIGPSSSDSQVYVLTIALCFAQNLIRLITNNDFHETSSNFFFMYQFLNNQVTTKPFGDIISGQINGERSLIRLYATIGSLKTFIHQLEDLEISFCANDRIIAKAFFDWKSVSNQLNSNVDSPIVVDQLLRLELLNNTNRASPSIDANSAPAIGLQICLAKESPDDTIAIIEPADDEFKSATKTPPHVTFADSKQTIHKEKLKSVSTTAITTINPKTINHQSIDINQLTEQMQLKAAYELQVWKEAREKEFEQQLKKMEAKNFQSMAEAFKQHDIERELLVQKKIKEYNDLEILLKNSLNEVEKREKQLAIREADVARLKVDLQRDYESKLIEMREASKRVQEKADHQVNLAKIKYESLEEEICKLKRHIHDWEKKYADKEADFARYRERESSRPELRLQSEINLINLEKAETERKLAEMTKAKNHYKEQWTRALQEISLIKKKEEANAKAMLKKQQLELDHLRMKFMANEEKEMIKSEDKQLQALRNELDRMRLNNCATESNQMRSTSELDLARFTSSSVPNMMKSGDLAATMSNTRYLTSTSELDGGMSNCSNEHVKRLAEEKETLLRTGVYSDNDPIILELDRRIKECLNRN